MKKLTVFVFIILFLAGCRHAPFGPQATIDWVDFIKVEGVMYDGVYSGVLADDKYIGEKIGEVKFRVADNVTNPNYKVKNGDAAFHEKGTEIFAIKGQPGFLAVKSAGEINGYNVYYSRDVTEFRWHFKDMPQEKVQRIEIYQLYTAEGTKRIIDISEPEKIQEFLQLLNSSEKNSTFSPNTEKGDPLYYEAVFYTDEPVAYKQGIQFDGHTYFWHPWDTSILDDRMEEFLLN
jgi:hypothetical protein